MIWYLCVSSGPDEVPEMMAFVLVSPQVEPSTGLEVPVQNPVSILARDTTTTDKPQSATRAA